MANFKPFSRKISSVKVLKMSSTATKSQGRKRKPKGTFNLASRRALLVEPMHPRATSQRVQNAGRISLSIDIVKIDSCLVYVHVGHATNVFKIITLNGRFRYFAIHLTSAPISECLVAISPARRRISKS